MFLANMSRFAQHGEAYTLFLLRVCAVGGVLSIVNISFKYA